MTVPFRIKLIVFQIKNAENLLESSTTNLKENGNVKEKLGQVAFQFSATKINVSIRFSGFAERRFSIVCEL